MFNIYDVKVVIENQTRNNATDTTPPEKSAFVLQGASTLITADGAVFCCRKEKT